MPVFVCLLRAVNVGGKGSLPMTELRSLCEKQGFKGAVTFIQSGNVVFESALPEERVKAKLEKALLAHMGKPVAVLVRTQAELESILKRNPWKSAAPNRVVVMFVDEPVPTAAAKGIVIPAREEVKVSGREVFVHYPDGQGTSKLRLPFIKNGTGRNISSITKLAELAKAHLTKSGGAKAT